MSATVPRWPLTLVLISIAAAAIALPAWIVATFDCASIAPSGKQVARLQAQAIASCKCARRQAAKQGKTRCWRTFDAAIMPHIGERPGGEACLPLTRNQVCLKGGPCIDKSYDIVVGDGEGAFCTRAEAMAAERLYDQQEDAPDGGFDALYRLSRAFADYDLTPVVEFHGCVGGAQP
ncbi:MAG: hypothetical protein V4574_00405 [Pseudomonadota bacterium]